MDFFKSSSDFGIFMPLDILKSPGFPGILIIFYGLTTFFAVTDFPATLAIIPPVDFGFAAYWNLGNLVLSMR